MQKQLRQLIYLVNMLLLVCTLHSCCMPVRLRSSQACKQSREAMMAAPYVAIQAKLNYRSEGKSYKGHVKIHIHRNDRIWISITHNWGGELGRCSITPAGVEVINRIDKTYQYYSYSQLQADWQLPCDYDLIQAILLGQLPYPVNPSGVSSEQQQFICQVHGNYVCTGTFDGRLQRLVTLCTANPSGRNSWCIFYKYNRTCQKDLLFSEAAGSFALFSCTLQYQDIRFSAKPLTFSFNRPK